MATNPLIALQVRSPDIAGNYQRGRLQALQEQQADQQSQRQNRLLDLQEQQYASQQQNAALQRQATQLQISAEQRKLQGQAAGELGYSLGPMISAGDFGGAQQLLDSTFQQLAQQGVPIQEPTALREALRTGNGEQALAMTKAMLSRAEKFGYVPREPQPAAAPAGVQTAEWYANATPEQRQAFDATQRSGGSGADDAYRQAQLDLARQRLQMQEEAAKQGRVPAGYRTTADGGLEAIPGGPADAKAQALAQQQATGATDVDLALGTLRDAYNRLEKGGGITSTEKGVLGNIGASASSSGFGQALGRAFGTDNQSARNDIAMARPSLLAALMRATGMSAKQMDSNAELKLWLATATDPTLDVESNRRALDNIEKKYLGGREQQPAPAPATPARVGRFTIEAID